MGSERLGCERPFRGHAGASAEQRAIRRSSSSASSGHSRDVGAATMRRRRARRRATTSAPAGSQAWPTNITIPWGSRTSASTAARSGSTDHSSSQLAHERVGGVLADVDRAAGAERPAPGPRREPWRAPAREPAPVASRMTQSAATVRDRVALDEPQRPARGLQLESASRPRRRCGRRAARRRRRGSASRARASARPPRRRRRCLGGRLEGSSLQRAVHLVGRPGSAGEEAGRVRSSTARVRAAIESRAQAHRLAACRRARATAGAGATRTRRSRADEARAAGRALARAARLRAAQELEEPVRARGGRAAGAAVALAGGGSPSLLAATRRERATHALRQVLPRHVRAFRGAYDHAPDFVARPRDEARRRGGARVGGGRERRGHPVRRRHERRRRRRGARPGALRRRGLARPRRARRAARGRRGLARGAHPGGRDRPAARGSSSASTA